MLLTLEVPDRIAQRLRLQGPQLEHRALELLALEGYRTGELSRGQVSEMLGLEFNETEAFLKNHGALSGLTAQDFARSREALKGLLAR